VTEVIPQKKIAYTWRYKGEVGDSLVTMELFPESNMTRLRLTHEGLETFPKTAAYARKNFEAGWSAIIGTELKNFVEGKQ
ncbi:MAG TPA: SRPBCC domain-containing protein, partial [Chthoniobacterales bacterium]|nr:SRPBCC domain-containing protein [Chthoniobacterales bacterium]